MKRFFILIVSIVINYQSAFSLPNYLMRIANTQVLNDSSISFEVYIKSADSSFELTSYQCVFCMDNQIPVSGFSYIEGSSQFNDILPSVGLGFNNIDGKIKLTFASMPGNEIVTINETRVGKFLIKTKINPDNFSPSFNWCFEGKINSILTGINFTNITNSSNHIGDGIVKLDVKNVSASSTSDTATSPEKTIDGKGANDGDENSRWATEPMPAYLIYDLGSQKYISETKFSFYNWNNGRIYHYSISTSDDSNTWNDIIVNDSSSAEEWTINSINKNTRYIKLSFISNNENSWAGLWEAQIFGKSSPDSSNVTTSIANHDIVPKDYSLSQNYPNPFNPTTKINFTLAESGQVNLDVYNILGEKITTLVNQEMTAGSHEINFNASNLASGIYIYRLNIKNKFIDTKKMILMK